MLRRTLLVTSLLILAQGCSSLLPLPTPVPTTSATPTTGTTPTQAPAFTPYATVTPLPPDTGWEPVRPGVEVRSLNVATTLGTERVTVARLDPAYVRFEVFYVPQISYPVSVWARKKNALLVVNGGYFTSEETVTGLTIANGESYGVPLEDYAGMFAVTEAGAVSVRWLRAWPYDPNEPLRQAIQNFPVLVKPGGLMGFPADADDGRTSRRTVVAQDRQGRVLFVVAPHGNMSLHALAVWLAESDLEVDVALNLDGGTSTGFWMAGGPQIESRISVPSVLAVFPR